MVNKLLHSLIDVGQESAVTAVLRERQQLVATPH